MGGGELGLRERKKRQTRQSIAERAFALFAERGFDRVTVAEIARAADVSEATVFNYFPAKEDLVYEGMEEYERFMLQGIRDRPADETVLNAFLRLVVEPRGLLVDEAPDAEYRLVSAVRIVADSPALQARERRTFDHYTQVLAELIAAEAGAGAHDVEPWVVANALLGVQRALLQHLRREVLAGVRGERLNRSIRSHGEQALALLETGLANYPVHRGRS